MGIFTPGAARDAFESPPLEQLIDLPDLVLLISHTSRALPRSVFEAMIEAMVERLDQVDGDVDMEDGDGIEDDDPAQCEAGDDGCGMRQCHGLEYWGSGWDNDSLGLCPSYGLDQTIGEDATTARGFMTERDAADDLASC